MIIAKKTHANCYKGRHARLDKALERLQDDEFIASVGTDKVFIEGDALYAFRNEYTTVPFEETYFEAHKKYLDIQMVVSGQEMCGIADPATLGEPFKEKPDFKGYHGDPEQCVTLRPDNFMIVFPGDAHRLKIAVNEPELVSKVVFKILVYEEE